MNTPLINSVRQLKLVDTGKGSMTGGMLGLLVGTIVALAKTPLDQDENNASSSNGSTSHNDSSNTPDNSSEFPIIGFMLVMTVSGVALGYTLSYAYNRYATSYNNRPVNTAPNTTIQNSSTTTATITTLPLYHRPPTPPLYPNATNLGSQSFISNVGVKITNGLHLVAGIFRK